MSAKASSTFTGFVLPLIFALMCSLLHSQEATGPHIQGIVLDPSARPVAGAHVEAAPLSGARISAVTGNTGAFSLSLPAWGRYTVRIEAPGFVPFSRDLAVDPTSAHIELRFTQIETSVERVTVSAGPRGMELSSPDPSEKIMVREELLDANPGRPGAPVSLPGLPTETAAGGIKAPQYFVPGVAGDHGEPIAQYIALAGFLVPNNLSANAHGNGYADPNIFIPATLASVETDGGAFNVLEGNHSLNLAATYSFRPQLKRFVTLTGDNRDLDLAANFTPADSEETQWIALEAAYGNGLLARLEHRQQYKWNAMRVFPKGKHDLTMLSIGYYGSAYQGGLVPLGMSRPLHDTLDMRQRDQTHTALLGANDHWEASNRDQLDFSGFFRTYNLALFSNFGEGLIRQSEFRTVGGAELREQHRFGQRLQTMAGLDYNEDDPRRDNLDHYLSTSPQAYGSFVKVLANNLTIRDVTPYVALQGDIGKHVHMYAGLRPDIVEMRNNDLLRPANSFDLWHSFLNPKATLTWTPSAQYWLPSVAFSMGQAYFTEDPRISVAAIGVTKAQTLASPFERSHSEQLVLEKTFSATDVRMTLGRTTTSATLAKIDPDVGLPQDLGPGTLMFLSASVRHQFSFGSLQGVFSKADARLKSTASTPGMVTPEAPRTILDGLTTLDRLPWSLHARSEYEYVGHKLLDVGEFEAVPVGETRITVVRPFLDGRLELGANGMIARGETGQTTETFAPDWLPGGAPPSCPAAVDGIPSNFDCGTVERSVGVRLPSYAGVSVSWRFSAF